MKKSVLFLVFIFLMMLSTSIVSAANINYSRMIGAIVVNNHYNLQLRDDISILNTTLGKALSTYDMNLEVPVTRYHYKHTQIYSDENNRIVCIASSDARFKNSGIQTNTSTRDNVIQCFGDPSRTKNTWWGELLVYHCDNNSNLLFSIVGGVVVLIQEDLFSSTNMPEHSIDY